MFNDKDFAGVIKYHEIGRLAQIIQVSSKYNH